MVSPIIKPSPTTIWNILDVFLIDLATGQDKICSEAPSLSKPLYQGLVDLVCKGDTRVLDDIDFGKPYYPFILITYYILFHRHNLEAAEVVFEKLKKAYEEHPYTFDIDEKCSFKVLEKVIEDFTKLKKQPLRVYKGRLNPRLREIVFSIENIECYPGGWGNAFKKLVISHLDPEKGIQILKEMPTPISNQITVIDEDVLEGYNLVVYENPPSTLVFLRGVGNAVYNALFNAFENLRVKEIEKNDLERKVVRIRRLIRELKSITGFLRALLVHLLPPVAVILHLCYLYYKWRLDKVKAEIDGFIEERILKEIYETIWPIS